MARRISIAMAMTYMPAVCGIVPSHECCYIRILSQVSKKSHSLPSTQRSVASLPLIKPYCHA
jgi:hypothetical protein